MVNYNPLVVDDRLELIQCIGNKGYVDVVKVAGGEMLEPAVFGEQGSGVEGEDFAMKSEGTLNTGNTFWFDCLAIDPFDCICGTWRRPESSCVEVVVKPWVCHPCVVASG